MKNLIKHLFEDVSPNGYIPGDDADALGSEYVQLQKYVNDMVIKFEERCRELMAAMPEIRPDKPITVTPDAPINKPVSVEVNIIPAIIYLRLNKDVNAKEYLVTKLTASGDYTNQTVISKDDVECISEKLRARILSCLKIVELAKDDILYTAKTYTLVDDFSRATEIMCAVISYVEDIIAIITNHCNYFYSAQNYDPSDKAKEAFSKDTLCDKYESDISRLSNTQDKWIEKFGTSNVEIDKKIQVLTEKMSKCRKDAVLCNEEATKESDEKVSKYIESLNKCIDDIRDFYENYEHKEFLEPAKRHIDKMEEYMKGAIDRNFALRIPLYTVNNASKEAKKLIRDEFIPKLSDVVDNHQEFIIMAPKFDDESNDMFIFLTLREPFGEKGDEKKRNKDDDPKGEVIQNESVNSSEWDKNMYDFDRDRKGLICVTAPDGRSLGCFDTYEDAKYDVMQDIREHNEKLKSNTVTEAILYKEDRDKLSDSDFGVPEIKGYPLTDEEHIRKAIQFFGYCKSQYKETLAKNIVKKIIEKDLVGKVTVSEKNPGKKYFPSWVLSNVKATMKKDKDTYHIFVDDIEVAHGTIPKEKKTTLDESVIIDPATGHTYM